MVHTLKQKATVKQGGVVEVRSPDLVPGSTVEVIILSEDGPSTVRKLTSLIGAGRGLFFDSEEVDRFIRKERDSWDD